MTIVVGGVGELYQSDLDIGRRVAERLLSDGSLPPHVVVEDLHYGAVAVVQRLEDLHPPALILVGAVVHGRQPGSVTRHVVSSPPAMEAGEAQALVEQAATGYVGIDLVVGVAAALGALPRRTVAFEVEPALTGPGEPLSPEVEALLPTLVEQVWRELDLTPLFLLADDIRAELQARSLQTTPVLEALEEAIAGLEGLDRDGTWGSVFRARDRLRLRLGTTDAGPGMESLDWGLWWSLIEELDRVEKAGIRAPHVQGR